MAELYEDGFIRVPEKVAAAMELPWHTGLLQELKDGVGKVSFEFLDG